MQLTAALRRAGRLAVAPNLFDDRHHQLKLVFGCRLDKTAVQVRPLRAHHVATVAGQPGPELFRDERHEGMEEAKEVVETEISDVLRRRLARLQPLFGRFEVPVTQLDARKSIRGVDGTRAGQAL